jgi:uncharacterized secreted repeat protein (TIGR03808 family)
MSHSFTRRTLMIGAAALAALAPARALAQLAAGMQRGFVNAAEDFEVTADGSDQSEALRKAVAAAGGIGLPLFIPAGTYTVNHIDLPSGITLYGVRGATVLRSAIEAPVITAYGARSVTVRNLVVDGNGAGGNVENPGLLVFGVCENLLVENLELRNGIAAGVHLERATGSIGSCDISGFSDGIFSLDSGGMILSRNRIRDCTSGGIRVWTSDDGAHDGSIVTENQISGVGFTAGDGQNGNGINVYRASGVTVANNHIEHCAFSAIRLNSTTDTIVSGNHCLDSSEVAIFSEFAFSGSVIADNIIDGAAQGISMTNFDSNGRLATCTGNIVRNILPASPTNPDTVPVGISAEADAVIANNVVEAVPGVGIAAGWGPYLRDVSVTGNVARDCDIGIGVSVAPGAGAAMISDNLVSGARRAGIAGLEWDRLVSTDLQADAAKFSNVMVDGNRVS